MVMMIWSRVTKMTGFTEVTKLTGKVRMTRITGITEDNWDDRK